MEEFTRESVLDQFGPGKVLKVTFTKKDGSERVMVCTRDHELIPEDDLPKYVKEGTEPPKENVQICNVYEIDNGWRSFRYDSVKRIQSAKA